MNKKLMRSSIFILLMFVLSVSLTGCSFSEIISGIKNALGPIISNVGKIVSKVCTVVKKVIEVVKPVVTTVTDAISKVTGKENTLGDKINGALDKVGGVVDKVDEYGQKITEVGENMKTSTSTSTASGTVDVNPTRDNETETATTSSTSTSSSTGTTSNTETTSSTETNTSTSTTSNTETTSNTSTTSSTSTGTGTNTDPEINWSVTPSTSTGTGTNTDPLSSPEDDDAEAKAKLEELKKEITTGINDVEKSVDDCIKFIKEERNWLDTSLFKSKSLVINNKLNNCKNLLEELKKDPVSQVSRAKYTLLQEDLKAVKTLINQLKAQSSFCKEGLQGLMSSVEDAYKTLYMSFMKVN